MTRTMSYLVVGLLFACQGETSNRGAGGRGTGATGTNSNKSTKTTESSLTYENGISSLLENYCTSCHNESRHDAGYDLSTFEMAKKNAEISLESMKEGRMPPKSADQMSKSDITKFETWVKNGTKQSSNSNSSQSTSTSSGGTSTDNDSGGANLVTYENWVEQYLTDNCVSCHKAQLSSGGYDLSTYDKAKQHAADSYDSMKGLRMPTSASNKASAADLEKMDSWVKAGAPEK